MKLIPALIAVVATVSLEGAQLPPAAVKTGTDAIMKADRDFNQAVADRDLKRFLSFLAEEATFNGGTPDEMRGRDAVAKGWAPFFSPTGPRLAWRPLKGEVIGHGDVGYTIGAWERHTPAADGKPASVSRGNYVTVWRKQADGSWKVVFDTGSSF
jgi:uncharacterized protein (TIGR02246 family)